MAEVYRPYQDRQPDYQYQQLLKRLLTEGEETQTRHDESARMVLGHQLRFSLSNGFPLITERDLSKTWRQALGEIIGFINGARTQEELVKFGCRWWERWVTKEECTKYGLPEGDLGPGSYGAAFHDFPKPNRGTFNQFEKVIKQIKTQPNLRSHLVTSWIPFYTIRVDDKPPQVVVPPCHGNLLHFRVINGKLHAHHVQRSADCPVGLVYNFVHYAALLMMVAQVTNLAVGELVYTISDAHYYASQKEAVLELTRRPPRPFPTVTLDQTVTDLFDFRPEHFSLADYHPHPAMRISTPL